MVRLLWEQEDISLHTVNTKYSQTPLSEAMENRHEGVEELLLELEDANSDTVRTIFGRAPLLVTSGNCH